LEGHEGDVFRSALKHSAALAVFIGLIVMFYAYVAPGWVPSGHKFW
jgi:L-lactate permease